ncbi:MAG: cytochrome b/b6 domain-containing protein [Dehalococcoidales bacterium]|nr:MAG: cytochrome b/b6 domain-containing protein [Dehalococcoidales bacterium]
MEKEVERYRKPTRILHWVHGGAFVMLFLTGLILFVPALGVLAQDGWSRVLHRAAAILFVSAPLIYLPLNGKATLRGLKDAFTWSKEDLGWLKAAPRYYFLGDDKTMPPQAHMNTGQKMWWLMTIVFGLVFFITGLIMAVLDTVIPAAVMQWMVFIHDIAFIVTGCMLLVHIYLSVIHPLMRPLRTGAWSSMARGKVSAEYARSHHVKWYNQIPGTREKKTGETAES